MVTLGEEGAAHLLRRAGFGGTPAEVSAFAAMTRQQAVNALFSDDGLGSPIAPDFDRLGIGPRAMTTAMEDWMERLSSVRANVREKQLLFWHSHFAINYRKVAVAPITWESHAIMHQRALGDFYGLLRHVSFSTAMVLHLDNETNVKGTPQENFARELMELHSLGNGNFTETDVVAMAQAWTGHNIAGTYRDGTIRYAFDSSAHDASEKTLFGIRRRWDAGDTLVELTSGVKAATTARFICKKLLGFYLTSEPSAALVNELTQTFVDDSLHVGRLLRRIFLHPAFWAQSARYSRVRWPIEYVTALSRSIGVPPSQSSGRGLMSSMGMILFEPPTVAGWGENEFWISSSNVWGKEVWLRRLGNEATNGGAFLGLHGQNAANATTALFRACGIYEPSNASTTAMRAWFNRNNRLSGTTLERHALQFAGLLPEVQLG